MLKRIVFIRSLALFIIIIRVLISQLIIFFEMMKIGFVELWKFCGSYLIIFPQTKISSKEFVQNIIKNLFSIVHLFTSFNCNSRQSKLKLEQNKSRISLMLQFRVIKVFGVSINKKMFVIKLIFFNSTWWHHSRKYLLNVLNINKMRYNIGLFKKSDKP